MAAALDDDAFHREIERRWSMQDYLSDKSSFNRNQPASDKQRLLDRLGERFQEFEATRWVSG